ncbi:MAG: PAS domain S-box protein, partial [Isosphaeraceae bacterium]
MDLGRSWIMGGGNTPVRIGMGPAALAAIAVVGLAWPLVEWPGAGALYLAYFAVVIVAAWKGGRNAALFVLVFVSCVRLLLAPFSAAPSASGQHWDAWVVSLYYGAAVSSVLLLDSRGRIGPSSQPVPASRPRRDPPSALGLEVIPPQVFLERSREGIHILDMNGRLRWSNDRFREILGYSHEEARSLHAWDWDTRFTREELLARLRQSTTAGVRFETSFRRQDGSLIDVEISGNRVEWKGQSFVYGVCQDISERKRAEKALLESEQRFRLLVDQAGDGFFAANKEGEFVEANQRACDQVGWSRQELLSMRVEDVAEGYDRQAVDEMFAGLVPGQPTTITGRGQRRDGSSFPVEVRMSTFTGQGGAYFLALVRDVTEREIRERELERTNRLYATLSAVSRTVESVRTREELFREVCRVTVLHSGFRLVWVGWHDAATHAITPVASAGDETGYLDGLELYADDRPEGQAPACVCFRTGKPCIVHDLADNPATRFWRERTIAHGVRTVASLPLRLGGERCGVFVVYAGETDVFQDREVELLQ